MKIQCPGCKSEYIVADHKIPENGASMRCPKCEKRFMVRRLAVHEMDPESLLRAQVRELSNSQILQKNASNPVPAHISSRAKGNQGGKPTVRNQDPVEVRFPFRETQSQKTAHFQFFQPVKDPSGLTRWLKYLLVANVFVLLAAIWSGWEEIRLLHDISSGRLISESQAGAVDVRQTVLGFSQFFLFVVTGIFFLSWIYRANRNARCLGAKGMKFSPGWSVGYFFIPVLNFWKPYQAMKEIWKASRDPENWANQSVGLVLGLWWTLWIVSSLLGHAAFRTSLQAKMVNEIILSSQLTFASDLISVPLCLVAIYIISRICQMQMEKIRPFLKSIA